MADFRKMYFQLAGKVNDAMDMLLCGETEAEETYIEHDLCDNIVYLRDYLDPDDKSGRSQKKGSCN